MTPLGDGDAVLVRDAEVVLGGRPVLRGVTLSVPEGDVVALMGPNGSGKSTLVRAAVGLLPLAHGEVRLFGQPLRAFRDRHRIGYVPQRTTASAGVPATVAEVVAAGRLSRSHAFGPSLPRDRAAVREALALVGLADRAGDGVAELSGGQQQRVLIARALCGDPDLLVLDEPTAGIDHTSQLALASVLRHLVRQGKTILLVAHELGPLGPLVDRAVILNAGRVVFDGPPPQDGDDTGVHVHVHPHADQGENIDRGLLT